MPDNELQTNNHVLRGSGTKSAQAEVITDRVAWSAILAGIAAAMASEGSRPVRFIIGALVATSVVLFFLALTGFMKDSK